jgi:uncharacterized protein (UPF0261 family)
MAKTVLAIGAFDTKGPDYDFIRQLILLRGHAVVTVNTGVLATTDLFPVDVEADELATAGGATLQQLRQTGDRGEAMKVMSAGAAVVARRLYDEGRFDGIIGMGGSGGSTVVTAAMRALPVGVPKVCVSTVASGDTSGYVGLSDVTLIPSIADVAGINRISRLIYSRAAGAICGMVETEISAVTDERPVIAASMFGNTTQCVDACSKSLTESGYEVLVFHATGAGGRTMESLVDEGLVDAVLDITTTEWADEVCGGVFSAGPDRLSGPGRKGIPHLIVPGCVDMANFHGMDNVPQHYRDVDRLFYEWNPSVALMRTNVEENRKMGESFADAANAAQGPVAFLFPKQGVSILDGDGEQFCDRVADEALFGAIRQHVKGGAIRIEEVDANINDVAFSNRAVEMMHELISQGKGTTD